MLTFKWMTGLARLLGAVNLSVDLFCLKTTVENASVFAGRLSNRRATWVPRDFFRTTHPLSLTKEVHL